MPARIKLGKRYLEWSPWPLLQYIVVLCVLLALGLIFPVFWPMQRVAGEHLLFVGGFSLTTFTSATRVVLIHARDGDLFGIRLRFLVATAALLLIAATLRVMADVLLPSRGTLLDFASYAWMLGGWSVVLVDAGGRPRLCGMSKRTNPLKCGDSRKKRSRGTP